MMGDLSDVGRKGQVEVRFANQRLCTISHKSNGIKV
jgi:hypothetical protein